jgi:hypothetical protein
VTDDRRRRRNRLAMRSGDEIRVDTDREILDRRQSCGRGPLILCRFSDHSRWTGPVDRREIDHDLCETRELAISRQCEG